MGEADDAILVVNGGDKVQRVMEADPIVLRAFLNDVENLHDLGKGKAVADSQRNPTSWGSLVMARGITGEVLEMDPPSFWEGIYDWFRSRGVDPHSVPPPRDTGGYR
jgi:hypothetical protein